ncbi:MAG TPA: NAD(P)H-dependent glycerol-3-phosphate dehydrogenase [Arachidicoccus soli]|uniref:Glycerol-3-phosphate dehydrogenase n=1 Tax=Arachidicoccus soli TaxID=2341117 RepID=A0A386HU86_9BACT|nr:NAD(P)H-dependent glycerol-3-phosphate dehydrogenase [Arachidicoccus soli]AYD49239.1 glycerol-3-phosphate dehydrogenase [Arachidicoccus soli]HEU0227590.1 NAD(P)H-dependent glycerol-3-phosphate dehydrogenase [Arachidicoccus soli]
MSKVGIVGSGSWATALAKLLTDNEHAINWWFRNSNSIEHFKLRGHNPRYLSKSFFDISKITFSDSIHFVIDNSDILLIATPSAYVNDALNDLPKDIFKDKKIISAVKGILPEKTELLHEYLQREFNFPLEKYFTVLGPCHAEEVAAEKLSYLTFSGTDESEVQAIAAFFQTAYLNTRTNSDVIGVQYAAVLKNIYALGAGIAHGLDYGDNFLSVYIANAADEMVHFLKKLSVHQNDCTNPKYASSVYLGDLLVTCYSLYSRNRMFGTMIGKGYSVKAAQLELNMVAEGYNASKCIFDINEKINADTPIVNTVYEILWNNATAEIAFSQLESLLH